MELFQSGFKLNLLCIFIQVKARKLHSSTSSILIDGRELREIVIIEYHDAVNLINW